MSQPCYDAVIIGGGIVGCSLALHLKKQFDKVLLLEREPDIFQRASYSNQARVHNGYHYPRSLLTALRSRVNFPRFVEDYQDCIDRSFDHYYGVAKNASKVTATQFKIFCQRIGVPIKPAPREIKRLFCPNLIDEMFIVQEYAFNAAKLKNEFLSRIVKNQINLEVNCKVFKITLDSDNILNIFFSYEDQELQVTANRVFNCTYSQINQILAASDLPIIPFKHELAEIALIEVPAHLKDLGVTIMCGPFFSMMPFPPLGLYTLSHVRYTPHHSWQDSREASYIDINEYLEKIPRVSNYPHMIKDAERYLPSLKDCQYVGSLWEVKTVLPRSEVDDSRPILFRTDHGLKNLACILGGKIDNIYDILDEIEVMRMQGGLDS